MYRATLLSGGMENWYCSFPSKGILRIYFSSFLRKSRRGLSSTRDNSFLESSILSFNARMALSPAFRLLAGILPFHPRQGRVKLYLFKLFFQL